MFQVENRVGILGDILYDTVQEERIREETSVKQQETEGDHSGYSGDQHYYSETDFENPPYSRPEIGMDHPFRGLAHLLHRAHHPGADSVHRALLAMKLIPLAHRLRLRHADPEHEVNKRSQALRDSKPNPAEEYPQSNKSQHDENKAQQGGIDPEIGSKTAAYSGDLSIGRVQFIQDVLEYNRTYHTIMDTYERLSLGDLKIDATIVAWLAICAANDPGRIPVNAAAAMNRMQIPRN